MFVRTGPRRRIVSPVRSPVTIVPSSLSSHQSQRKAAHRRQALVAIAEAHERAGADEAVDTREWYPRPFTKRNHP